MPKQKKILLVDNYDSFTFNLEHLIRSVANTYVEIKRNDEKLLHSINDYDAVIISPGPGSPENDAYFGNNKKLILNYGTQGLPILGICLGFQGIIHLFGGKLKIAPLPMHGKISKLKIASQHPIVQNIPQNIDIMRYHSIYADCQYPLPDCLEAIAYAKDKYSEKKNKKELMIVSHKKFPIVGLQFHPESFATEYGKTFIENFLSLAKR